MSVWVGVDTMSPIFERVEQFLSTSSPQLKALWAKSGDEFGWLPLVQHLGDAACVAECLWDGWVADSVKVSLQGKSDISGTDLRTVLTFLAGVHDLGKVTVKFARQIEFDEGGRSIVDGIAATGLPMKMTNEEVESPDFRHGLVGEVLLTSWLRKQGCPSGMAAALGSVIGAHHGIASTGDARKRAGRILRNYPVGWSVLQEEILVGMSGATGFHELLSRLPRRFNADVTMRLAGLVVMADWIASNAHAFPMTPVGSQAERVRTGFDMVALTRPWQVEVHEDEEGDEFYRRVFGWSGEFCARPVQKAAIESVADIEGSCLVIIEAPTGEGKTEAALAVGQQIAATTGAQGLLLAAPTMGTSNGLFPRVLEWARRNTPQRSVTSMNLIHSRSFLSGDLRNLRMSGIGEDSGGDHGSVVASQWMKGPKKAILSDFVVATVDQVLMLALQMRYSMLRHIGLAGKVIIVDEVHSYDLYMSSYLKLALGWLARYGVSVILLSATLPQQTKLALVKAYGSENEGTSPEELSEAYPMITVVDQRGVREIEVSSRPTDMETSIEVIPDSVEHLAALVEELTQEGGCLLIICNTVRRAQESYRTLSRLHPGEVELHHSAFLAAERAFREDKLRRDLGPDAHRGAGRPYRKIICATQVAEQSLDIDADTLITDIAPMDLLVQRIGRIHRHKRPAADRPASMRSPQVYIRGIVSKEPVPVFDGGSEAVYEPAVLMSTFAHLPRTFRRPDDISGLVQRTYSPMFVPPEAWVETYAAAKSQLKLNRAEAERRASTFQIPHPEKADNLGRLFERYHPSMKKLAQLGEEAGAAQVRDTDPTIEVIPIIGTDYGYRPMPHPGSDSHEIDFIDDAEPDEDTAFHLASSVIRLPSALTRFPRNFDAVIAQLEKDTPIGWLGHYLLKGQVALRLDEQGEINLNGRYLRYSSEFGLEIVSKGEAEK